MIPRSSLRMNSLSSTMRTRPRRRSRPSKYDIGVAHGGDHDAAVTHVEVDGAAVIPADFFGLNGYTRLLQREPRCVDVARAERGSVIVEHRLEHRGTTHHPREQAPAHRASLFHLGNQVVDCGRG